MRERRRRAVRREGADPTATGHKRPRRRGKRRSDQSTLVKQLSYFRVTRQRARETLVLP